MQGRQVSAVEQQISPQCCRGDRQGGGFIGKKSWGNPWEKSWNKYGLIDGCGDFWMGKKSMGKEGKEMEV